jgi:DMSO/TMAO reductase YedYZ molybdopterin-dependent catalytic subunit
MGISRRRFIKGSVGLGAALVMGCEDDTEGATSPGDLLDQELGEPAVSDLGSPDVSREDSGEDRSQSLDGTHETNDTVGEVRDLGDQGDLHSPDRADLSGCHDPFEGGEYMERLSFLDESSATFVEVTGSGLDARLRYDLSQIEPGQSVTPTSEFYVRTEYPDTLDPALPWEVQIGGLVVAPQVIDMAALEPLVQPIGVSVLECSGNTQSGAFGLLSACEWSGVPVTEVLSLVEALPEARGVLISGYDIHSLASSGSIPGASWVFTFEQLEAAGAIFATHMNGEPLTLDHGSPIRLYLPNWYGCSCIKWVNEIIFVDEMEEATLQMKEFASRTHQDGVPDFALDYIPATMEQSAMPVRIERWEVEGETRYRLVGIMWGGFEPTSSLEIRFNEEEDFQPLDVCPPQTENGGWTVFTHLWRPDSPGEYTIRLQIADPTVPTIRLDSGWYDRQVIITD